MPKKAKTVTTTSHSPRPDAPEAPTGTHPGNSRKHHAGVGGHPAEEARGSGSISRQRRKQSVGNVKLGYRDVRPLGHGSKQDVWLCDLN